MSQLHYYAPATGAPVLRRVEVDLCCYGQSPAVITAALAAKGLGLSVAIVTNARTLGGLTTGGLSNTDIGSRQAIGGLAREFYRRVGAHYGLEEEWRFEPQVALDTFEKLIAVSGVVVHRREYPQSVLKAGARLRELHCESGLAVAARYFIDGSYEGDLLALAAVSFRIGRESNEEYGERHNGVQMNATHQFDFPVDPYVRPGDSRSGLLPGVNPLPLAPLGSGDTKVQAYNFRMCLTQAADRIPFSQPDSYDPRNYELLARYLRAGWRDVFHKFDRIRGGKADVNNHGAVSTDYVGASWEFPAASWTRRERIFQNHVEWQRGLFWFLSSSPRVPATIRRRFLEWGLPRDEFVSTDGWPPQLYIRESRRMVGEYIITEHDCLGATVVDDAIGLGAYGMDSHNCQRVVVQGCVRNEGDVQIGGFPPYPISYRAILPRKREAENLLVPVCLSATHIAYGSVRMEPVFMILGQSAGTAVALAAASNAAVQDVPYQTLRRELLASGQILAATPLGVYEPEASAPAD